MTAVCESADKESTTSDLMDPAVDKEIGASEMKADLRKYSDWMIDADCQTQGDVIVPTVDQAVNTEAAAVSDGAIQVKCLVTDQSVGPDLAVASRYADAMTSMESSVVCVDNFTEAETVSAIVIFRCVRPSVRMSVCPNVIFSENLNVEGFS